MTTRRNKTTLTLLPHLNSFKIVEVHRGWDLRTVQWRDDVLQEYVKNHSIVSGEAHVFINRNCDKSRWVVVWASLPFLVMAPTGSKITHMAGMNVAAHLAATKQIRQEILDEIAPLR